MKINLIIMMFLAAVCVPLHGEPLTLEQSGNVLQKGEVEVGINDAYFQHNSVIDPSRVFTTEMTIFPLYLRLGLTRKIEAATGISLGASYNAQVQQGDTSLDLNASGQGYSDIFVKYSRNTDTAFSLRVDVPSRDSVFSQGYNLMGVYIRKINTRSGNFNSYLNIGYDYTGEYFMDIDNDSVNEDVNQQDIVFAAFSLEHYGSQRISFIGEFILQQLLTGMIVDGVEQNDTTGSRVDAIIGVRAHFGNLKTKLGVDLSLGEERSRSYDYRIILGISYLTDYFKPLLDYIF